MQKINRDETSSYLMTTRPSSPSHQCLVNISKWKLRHELEYIHLTNTQVVLQKLQNRIIILCVYSSEVSVCHMIVT